MTHISRFLIVILGINMLILTALSLEPLPNSVQKNIFDFSHVKSQSSVQEQNIAVQNLLERLLGPDLAQNIEISVNKNITYAKKDAFHIFKKKGSNVSIEGSTVSGATSGLHYFLKHYLHCHVSWDYNQCALTVEDFNNLPDIDLHIKYPESFRFFQNVCTTSYSYVWWDWSRWEREIDRWALNGINMAYALTGMEAIWSKIYKNIGMNDDEINDYFTGPAFLAWNRMGNLKEWMGPLSDSWHSKQSILQRRILSRMRELSITPVLPAFTGIVPRAFSRLFPNSTLIKTKCWNKFEDKFCCPLLLHPTDPLFKDIGRKFIKEVIAQYGTNHVYSSDTFNENPPVVKNLDEMRKIGQVIFESMTSVDPNAIWLLQGWMFSSDPIYWTKDKVKALLTSVPLGKIIVLDLFAEQIPTYERLNWYFGQPFIWCMLHNFGGTLGMHGSLPSVNDGVYKARNSKQPPVGLGMVPEGIEQNYVVYDFMSDVFWSTDKINLTSWVQDYSRRRYGVSSTSDLKQAWVLLKDTVYSYNGSLGALHGKYKICIRPSLSWFPETWYNTSLLFEAWRLMLKTPIASSNYNYDVVDVTRQSLQVLFSIQFDKLLKAVHSNNIQDFQEICKIMNLILGDMEKILATEAKFLLGVHLKSARQLASNELESHRFESNIKNQITIWGPNAEINDYATKQWSGLVSKYFIPRWSLFFTHLNKTLARNVSFDNEAFKKDVFQNVEKPFTYNIDIFPDTPQGSSYETAKTIYENWKSNLF